MERPAMIRETHDIDEAFHLGDPILVMPNRPGTVKHQVHVHLPRPHKRGGADFVAARQAIYQESITGEEALADYMV